MSPLSESALSTFAAAPGDAKAQEAYRQVKFALEKYSNLSFRNVDIYLQGSYRNRTHIKEDSDVDVVAELQSSFYYNVDKLTQSEKSLFQEEFPTQAEYGFDSFKNDVRSALVSYFGDEKIREGNKCLKVTGNSQRSDADVLACLEHRKYINYTWDQKRYIPGIEFRTRDGKRILNWPKVHFKYGASKNKKTDNKFKGLVRIFKQLRNILVDANIINENLAPSYFVECLLYNVTDNYYGDTYYECLTGAISFFQRSSFAGFLCVSEQDLLFNPNNGWNTSDAETLINSISAVNQAVSQ